MRNLEVICNSESRVLVVTSDHGNSHLFLESQIVYDDFCVFLHEVILSKSNKHSSNVINGQADDSLALLLKLIKQNSIKRNLVSLHELYVSA